MPIIHAAEMDPARTPSPDHFDPGRPAGPVLAFGTGIHACPGRALSLLAFDEGLAALASLQPGLQLASLPLRWLPGTMPVPAELPFHPAAQNSLPLSFTPPAPQRTLPLSPGLSRLA